MMALNPARQAGADAPPGSAVRLARAAQEFTARKSRTYRSRVPAIATAAVEERKPALPDTIAADDPANLERAELLALVQRQQATIRDQACALSVQRNNIDAAVSETLRAAEELATDTLCAAAEEEAHLAAAAQRELTALRLQLAEERPRAQILEAELAAVTSELIATRSDLGAAVSHLALLRDRMQTILFGKRKAAVR